MLAMSKVRGMRWAWLALAMGFIPASAPAVTTPNQFVQSQKIVANDVNANFKALADAVTTLEAATAQLEKTHATPYLGKTAAKSGAAGGYAGVKALCVAATGNPNARICTSHDIVLAASSGQPIDTGWYAGGIYEHSSSFPEGRDCVGFTNGTSSYRGLYWHSASSSPSHAYCHDAMLPFLCCR